MGTWVNMSDAPDVVTHFGNTHDLVENRFDLAEQYARENLTLAQQYITDLTTLLNSLEVPSTETIEDIEVPTITPLDYSARPEMSDAIDSFPEFDDPAPTMEALADVPDIDTADIPEENFNFTENIIPVPSFNDIAPPDDNITINTVETPAKPDLTTPAPIAFEDLEIPAPPTISLPDFDLNVPNLGTLNDPAPFSYTEAPYNSDVWSDLLDKVLTDIRNGGTGLDVTVEAELYDRARDRQRDENERLYRESEDTFSATGFPLPPGALAARLAEVSAEISRKNDQMSREIMINQAELAQKNTQFMVEKGIQLEGILRDFFNQQSNRALDAAKSVATIGIEVFKALVTKYSAALESYKAEAAVYESRIKAALTTAEIYKTQIQGLEVSAKVQSVKADVYRAQVEAVNTVAKIYETEMQAAKVQSEVELSKLEVFKAQTQAYVAQLEGEKTKFQVYSAQVDGEKARVQVYAENVKAYIARVEAAKSTAEIEAIAAENVLKTNQLKIDKYRADLARYQAQIEAEIKSAGLQVEAFKTEVLAYNAETDAVKAENLAKIQEMTANVSVAELRLKKAVAQIEAISNSYVALKELQSKGTEGIMNVGAQLAASAMNAVNASASYDASSRSSRSESQDWNASISESHKYEHE